MINYIFEIFSIWFYLIIQYIYQNKLTIILLIDFI